MVVHVAVALDGTDVVEIGATEHPGIGEPLSEKATSPPISCGAPAGLVTNTEAVYVTGFPSVEGLGVEETTFTTVAI
jgi:hypothetical protein